MDFDTQFYDDSTSCSSSLSTPFGEDIDDLRLGAEANMFSPRTADDKESEKTPVKDFVIMKEKRGGSCENLDVTYSTISSISELIDAREGNPEDLLFSLGFASFEGEESHDSILSRFSSHPAQDKNFRSCDQRSSASGSDIVLDTRDSITKTQEWLNNQQHVSDSPQTPSFSKEVAGGSKNGNGQTQVPGKRMAAQKKRLRWSRSRQSSFDLLPNLEEEEAPVNVEESDGGFTTRQKEMQISLIRESSQEKEDFQEKATEDDAVSSIIQDKDEPNQRCFCFNEKSHESKPIDLCDSCKCNQVTDSKLTATSIVTNTVALEPGIFLTDSMNKGDQLSSNFSPLKRLNLANMKLDSFELEEIISNDGRTSPNFSRSSKQSVTSIVPNTTETGLLHTQYASDPEATQSSSSLASTDSSSGFDEGLEDTTHSIARQNSTSSIDEIPKEVDLISSSNALMDAWATKMSGAICSSAVQESNEFSQKKVKDFCAMKSKIACASGIAEYALLVEQERRESEKLDDSLSLLDCPSQRTLSPPRQRNREDAVRTVENNDALIIDGPRCDSVNCTCKRLCRSQTSEDSENAVDVDLCHRASKRQERVIPNSSPVVGNTNNNNNCNDLCNSKRVVRYSSMPSLHLPSPQRYRKTTSHSYFSNNQCSEKGQHTSLMSSISDVTYLSYRVAASKPPKPQSPCRKESQASNNLLLREEVGGRRCSSSFHRPPNLSSNDAIGQDGTASAQHGKAASSHNCQPQRMPNLPNVVCITGLAQQHSLS